MEKVQKRLALGYGFTQDDMFYNLRGKMKTKANGLDKQLGYHDRKEVMYGMIFGKFMQLVLDDMIENGVTFEYLLRNEYAYKMYFSRVDGEKFKRYRQAGGAQDIDFLASNFCTYFPTFEFVKNGRIHRKKIHLVKEDQQRIAEKINSGMKYC